MNAQRKVVHIGLFTTQVVDSDLRIRDTTTEPGFWIWFVFAVAVTEKLKAGKFWMASSEDLNINPF